MNFFLFIFFSFGLSLITARENDQLLGVIDVFRHGARSPAIIDKNKKDLFFIEWDIGKGELTDVGYRQAYLQGFKNKMNFILSNDTTEKLLSSVFDPNEIEIYSTNLNRTLQTAYSKMAGMYPPGTGPILFTKSQSDAAVPPVDISKIDNKTLFQLKNNSIMYGVQPLPVKISQELFIQPTFSTYCKGMKDEYNYPNKTADVFKFNLSLKQFDEEIYPNIKEKINKNYSSIKTVLEKSDFIFNLYDSLISNQFRNMSISNLNLTIQQLNFLYSFADDYYFIYNPGTMDKIKIGGSPFFNYLVDYGKGFYENGQSSFKNKKYIAMSSHDSNIIQFYKFLENIFITEGNPVGVRPKMNFNSNFMVKFYKSQTILFLFDDVVIYQTNFIDLKAKVQKYAYIPADFNKICVDGMAQDNSDEGSKITETHLFWLVISFVFLACLNIIFIFIIIYLKHCYKSKNRYIAKNNKNSFNLLINQSDDFDATKTFIEVKSENL